MIQIDWLGVIITMLAVNPRYWLAGSLAIVLQETGRAVFVWMAGGELARVVLGGVFGYTQGRFPAMPWLQVITTLVGPLLCIFPYFLRRPVRWTHIVFSWWEIKSPYPVLLFRIGLINLLIIFYFFLTGQSNKIM